ncbi:MAG: DUF2062 domain-containing protein, partial [Cytophagales bacterium]|nr:DUF2062 domain-containing protein [Cytophagales bacterium]
ATKLVGVLSDVLSFTDKVIVVNDGSTDNTLEILANYPMLTVVTYPKNKGKGWALRTGFRKALELGYSHVISMDSDSQHLAKDIPSFLTKLETDKKSIVVGARNLHQENMPSKNSFANEFSNFWFKVATGLQMPDTQSGYRLYPIAELKDFHFFTSKYEFEIEVMVRASWAGIKIDHTPISVFYPKGKERITHFKPFRDFSRISVLNTVIVLIAFLWIKPRDFFRHIFSKSLSQLWREYVTDTGESNFIKSASVAFGIFMGIVPLWSWQLAIGIPTAHFLRLNKVIFVLAANISIPPLLPFVLFFSYAFGGLLLGNPLPEISMATAFTMEFIKTQFFQYAIGACGLAAVLGLVSGAITFIVLSVFKSKSGERMK